MTVAEGTTNAPTNAGDNKLQWGRNLTVAEGADAGRKALGLVASMGPQLDSCGRRHLGDGGVCLRVASMGP